MTRPRIEDVEVPASASDGDVPTVDTGVLVYAPPAGGSYTDPLTTKGDLVGRSSSATGRVPVGTNDYALVADSTQTFGVRWADLGGLYVPKSLVDAKGDLLTATANDTPARLAVGSNGQVLSADSAETTGLKWIAALADPTTTKGDILARTSSALVRRPVGSNGQVLTADSAETDGVKWATPAGGTLPKSIDNLTDFNTVYGSTGTDYEMEGSGTSVPSGLSFINQSTSTVEENLGALVVRIPASATDNVRAVVGSLTGTTWTAVAKLSIPPRLVITDVQNYGLIIRDSTSSKLFSFAIIDAPLTKLVRWTSPTAFSAFQASAAWGANLNDFPGYWKIKKNSATSYDFSMSYDGVAWTRFFAAADVSAWLTAPDQVGFYITNNGSKVDEIACHWMRFRT